MTDCGVSFNEVGSLFIFKCGFFFLEQLSVECQYFKFLEVKVEREKLCRFRIHFVLQKGGS